MYSDKADSASRKLITDPELAVSGRLRLVCAKYLTQCIRHLAERGPNSQRLFHGVQHVVIGTCRSSHSIETRPDHSHVTPRFKHSESLFLPHLQRRINREHLRFGVIINR